jgi:hypothetical protein
VESVKRGVIHSPHDEAAGQRTHLLLTNYAHNEKDAPKGDEEDGDEGGGKANKGRARGTRAEVKTGSGQNERDDERDRRNQACNRSFQLDKVDFYWMS